MPATTLRQLLEAGHEERRPIKTFIERYARSQNFIDVRATLPAIGRGKKRRGP